MTAMSRSLRTAVIILSCVIRSWGGVPYESYLYNRWMEATPVPHSYVPRRLILGRELVNGGLKYPNGLFVYSNGDIFIADTGNNRVVRFDREWNPVREYNGFNEPNDLYVTDRGRMYVADTGNGQIVEMDLDGNVVRVIGRPESDLVERDFIYKPMHLVLDNAERIYIVAQGVNKGLIELDKDGIFKGFFGANKVTVNPIEYLWKIFSTQAQRESMRRFVPTVYNNVTIDSEGFIFATTSALNEYLVLSAILYGVAWDQVSPVRRLNPKGDDILKRLDWFPPVGDIRFNSRDSSVTGPSAFIDIVINESGIYHTLDQKRGRIFTYDPDGILLSIFGGIGNRTGLFKNPVALERIGDDLAVLDSSTGNITLFSLTEYGRNVQTAIRSYYSGKYNDSLMNWQKALKENANLEWAYWGIGNAYYRRDQFKEAMKYFTILRYGYSYSQAFRLYRKEVLQKNFGLIVGITAVLIIGAIILRRLYKRRRRRRGMHDLQ